MEYACNGDNSRVPLLLDLMSAQEVQDFYAGWALHQTGKIYSDYYGSQGLLYYLLTYVSQGGFSLPSLSG